MEEKRLKWLMMLQIHRSDTPSTDAVIHQYIATTAARKLNFLIWTYTCTTLYSTIDSFLNIDILIHNPVILKPYKKNQKCFIGHLLHSPILATRNF